MEINFNTPEIMAARALYRVYLNKTAEYPWNRSEDAEARALYRTHLERKKAAIDYYYVPEIFREVTEDKAYEMYWAAMAEGSERDHEQELERTGVR